MTGKGFFRKIFGYFGFGCRSSTSRGVIEPRRRLHPSTSQTQPQQPPPQQPPLSDDSSSEHPSPRAHFPSSPGRLLRSYSMNNTTDLNAHQLQFLRDYKPARRDPSHKKPLRKFVCLMCSERHNLKDIHYTFERKNQLRRHNKENHSDAPFKCKECWNVFYSQEDFNQHMIDYHPDPRMERGESSTTFSALPTYSDSVFTMPYQDRNSREVPESSRRASYSVPSSRQRGLADLGISQNTPNIPSLTHRAYTYAEGRSSSLQPIGTIAPLSERFYNYSSFSQGGPSHEVIVSAAEQNNNVAVPEASEGPTTSSSMGHGYVQLKFDMFIGSGFGRGRGRGRGGGGGGNI